MSTLRSIDKNLMFIHQVVYNYLLDRWGIYVGTYRASFVMIGLVIERLADYWRFGGQSMENFASWTTHTVILLLLYWMLFLSRHLKNEWVWQEKNKLDRLNRFAMQDQDIFVGRWLAFFLVVALMLSFGGNRDGVMNLTVFIHTMIFLQWLWAKTVMVRERDSSRFEQRKLAYNV